MTRLVKEKVKSKFQNDKDNRRTRSKDDRRIDRRCFDDKTIKKKKGMKMADRPQEIRKAITRMIKKIKKNLITVNDLLYKY